MVLFSSGWLLDKDRKEGLLFIEIGEEIPRRCWEKEGSDPFSADAGGSPRAGSFEERGTPRGRIEIRDPDPKTCVHFFSYLFAYSNPPSLPASPLSILMGHLSGGRDERGP